eukprot:2970288-Prorocentrum_lima.AAC.1
MTSSLVGSEMCIRDSKRIGAAFTTPMEPMGFYPENQYAKAFVAGNIRGCLLYTSDAADDM